MADIFNIKEKLIPNQTEKEKEKMIKRKNFEVGKWYHGHLHTDKATDPHRYFLVIDRSVNEISIIEENTTEIKKFPITVETIWTNGTNKIQWERSVSFFKIGLNAGYILNEKSAIR